MAWAGEVTVSAGDVALPGILSLPDEAPGLVVFADGAARSRFEPRNRSLAEALNRAGLGTLLVDLVTPREDRSDRGARHAPLDVVRLARRLAGVTGWLRQRGPTQHLAIGYFGAGTGAAAALVTAASLPSEVAAVVSGGGRPELAGPALPRVRAPTLLIVGGEDAPLAARNRRAFEQLCSPRALHRVRGATQRFVEPGAREELTRLSTDWFDRYLRAAEAHLGDLR